MMEKIDEEFDCDGGEIDDKENCAIRTKPEQISVHKIVWWCPEIR